LIRELASRVLDKLGYEAVTCADGEAAVRLFRAAQEGGTPFRGVLLDLTVPGGMGGKEAAAQIRALDPEAILIVSTGYCNDPVVADCQAFGFAGAVAKPYAAEALAAELARLLIAQKI
jgi:CheY-like chemotaxis protein